MELGLIPTINQYADNQEILIQQINPSSEIAKFKNGDEARQIAKDNFLKGVEATSEDKKTSETSETNKVSSQELAKFQEVVLTNLNFGYNDSSRDFYVRSVRGDAESQYPTDEMMKLKAYFIAQAQAESNAELNN